MAPQTLGVYEGVWAEAAGVRPLPGVDHPVPLEAGGVFVGLAAVFTLVGSDRRRQCEYRQSLTGDGASYLTSLCVAM